MFEGNSVFDDGHLRGLMKLEPGKFLRDEVLQQDTRAARDAYGEIGYIAARIDTRYDFLEEPGVVVLRYLIAENMRSMFGRITIRGNTFD